MNSVSCLDCYAVMACTRCALHIRLEITGNFVMHIRL